MGPRGGQPIGNGLDETHCLPTFRSAHADLLLDRSSIIRDTLFTHLPIDPCRSAHADRPMTIGVRRRRPPQDGHSMLARKDRARLGGFKIKKKPARYR